MYNDKSIGPYKVFVQANASREEPGKTVSPFFIIKFLIKANVRGVKEINKLGRKKVTVKFDNYLRVNEFVRNKNKHPEISNFDIYVPQHLMSCVGVVLIDMSE